MAISKLPRRSGSLRVPVLISALVLLIAAATLYLTSSSGAEPPLANASAAPTLLGSGLLQWAAVAVAVAIGLGLMLLVTLYFIERERRRAMVLASRMTQALRDSEAAQRAVVDCSADGIVTIDARGILLSFNRAAERMFGYRTADVVSRNVTMLMPERYRGRHDRYVVDFNPVDHGRLVGLRREVTGLRRSGEEFPMTLAINVVDSSGPRRYVGVISDIGERKKAEQALRDSEERFRLMVASVGDYAIFMLDTQGRIASWNAGAERIKGYTPAEILGEHFSRFYPDEDIRSGKPQHELEVAAVVGRFEDRGWRLRKDGSRFFAHVVITAVRDSSGQLLGYSKVSREMEATESAAAAAAATLAA